MGQQDVCDTASCNHVNDTIAFGSMLVFASVMPPLGSDAVEGGRRSGRKRADSTEGIGADPAKKPAARSRRRFDS